MIDRQHLLDELQSLSRQETETRSNLMRIEGAVQMARHLLDCLDRQEADAAPEAMLERNGQQPPVQANGRPLPPHGPENEISGEEGDGADFQFH